MEGHVGEEAEEWLNKEPVEVRNDGGDVLPGPSGSKETGGRVLDVFMHNSRGKMDAKAVAASLEVMKACMSISTVMGEGGLETCAFAEVKERCFSDMVNVRLAGQGRVHFSGLVVCRGGHGDHQ